MGDLFWNKVFGAILAVILIIMGLQTLSHSLFPMGGDGGHHGEEEGTLNEWAQSRFAYYTDIAETAGAGAAEEEEVYDLGALLANADAANGERSFKAKCSTCHTIEQGGGNGTGPNIHAIIGASHAHSASFGYSSAMQATSGETWTYENIDHWLENPSSYIRGTSMAFAGLRRDDERADVIAYLASMTPDAPAFPEPLPEEEEGSEGEGETEGEAEATDASAEAGEGEAAGDTASAVTSESGTAAATDGAEGDDAPAETETASEDAPTDEADSEEQQ